MPNICENRLEIHTTNTNLVRWIENFCKKGEIEYDDFSPAPPTGLFQFIAPMPSELEGTTKGNKPPQWQVDSSATLIDKYGADNWYDWQCNNWGTKWDVYVKDVVDYLIKPIGIEGEYYVCLEFNTAWGPPTQAIKRLKMSYGSSISSARIQYVAEGDFCGIYDAITGEQIEDTEFIDNPDLPMLADAYRDESPVWDYGWILNEVKDRVAEVAEYHNERLREVANGS